jgi:uncharacterized protein (TIGR03083 family)
VRVYDLIVAERLRMADMLASLTDQQLRSASLCDGWTVHDVAAHLVTYLRCCQLKIYLAIITTGADFDRFNLLLTRRAARRSAGELTDLLRRRAAARSTIPRSGFDPVLADLMLHDLDIRRPLGILRSDSRAEQLWVACRHLATKPSPGFGAGSRLSGFRFAATDAGWRVGSGPLVRGTAEDILLAMGGREKGFAGLDGDGVAALHSRLAAQVKPGALRRLAAPLGVVLNPPARNRRSKGAVAGLLSVD